MNEDKASYIVRRITRTTGVSARLVKTRNYGHALAVFADACESGCGPEQSIDLRFADPDTEVGDDLFRLDRTCGHRLQMVSDRW